MFMTTRTQGKTLDSLLWDSEFYRHGSDLSDRKETSMEKGAETSDCFRKRRKVDYSTNGIPKCTEIAKEKRISDASIIMDKSSLEFPRRSQDELRKIYGERRRRPVIQKDSTEGSEESEEEKPLTEEEQKRTVGHQLLMKHQERLAMGNKM